MTVKVLLISKQQQALQLVKETLEPVECQLITATSVALGVFLARKNFPSLVIVAPEFDNDEFLEVPASLKDDPDLAAIPVVMLAPGGKDLPSCGADLQLSASMPSPQLLQQLDMYLVDVADKRPPDTPE